MLLVVLNAQRLYFMNKQSKSQPGEQTGENVPYVIKKKQVQTRYLLDWLQSLKQIFIIVSNHILVASLTLMALF